MSTLQDPTALRAALSAVDAALGSAADAGRQLTEELGPGDVLAREAVMRSLDRIAQLRAVLGGPGGPEQVESLAESVARTVAVTVAHRPGRPADVRVDGTRATHLQPPEAVRIAVATIVSGAISNALRHGPGGTVSVVAGAAGGAAEITVQNGASPDAWSGAVAEHGSGPAVGPVADACHGHGVRLMARAAREAGGALSMTFGTDGSRIGARFGRSEASAAPDLQARAAFASVCLREHGAAVSLREARGFVPRHLGGAVTAALADLDQAEFALLTLHRSSTGRSGGEARRTT